MDVSFAGAARPMRAREAELQGPACPAPFLGPAAKSGPDPGPCRVVCQKEGQRIKHSTIDWSGSFVRRLRPPTGLGSANNLCYRPAGLAAPLESTRAKNWVNACSYCCVARLNPSP